MLLLSLVLAAPAADLPVDPDVQEAGRPSSGSSSDSGGSGKKKTASDDGGTKGKKGKILGWTWQPYIAPGGGVQIDNSGTSVVAGADAGIIYTKRSWSGDLYAGLDYTTGTVTGYDVHAGNVIGTRKKYWGVQGGAEFVYSAYASTDGSFDLDPSAGVGIPVEVTVGPKKYYAFGGVTPAILFTQSRSVPGLAPFDELEWNVGAGVSWKGVKAEAGFAQRITAAGTINTPTISVNVGQ